MKDFLSDMLTRIRNGQRAGVDVVELHPYMPRICRDVLEILHEEGFIHGFSIIFDEKIKTTRIQVYLKYKNTNAPLIEHIFRISTPGRRIYVSTKVLWKPKSTSGIFIFSTPLGIMTDREARLLNLGGELLCGVY